MGLLLSKLWDKLFGKGNFKIIIIGLVLPPFQSVVRETSKRTEMAKKIGGRGEDRIQGKRIVFVTDCACIFLLVPLACFRTFEFVYWFSECVSMAWSGV